MFALSVNDNLNELNLLESLQEEKKSPPTSQLQGRQVTVSPPNAPSACPLNVEDLASGKNFKQTDSSSFYKEQKDHSKLKKLATTKIKKQSLDYPEHSGLQKIGSSNLGHSLSIKRASLSELHMRLPAQSKALSSVSSFDLPQEHESLEESEQRLETEIQEEKEPCYGSKEEITEELYSEVNIELKEEIKQENNPFSTLETLCLKGNKRVIHDYIDQNILKTPAQCKLFFETLLSLPLQAPLSILKRVLKRMKEAEIFSHRHLLETIKSQRDDCAHLITLHLHRAYALALIHAYLKDATNFTGQAALLSHCWYLPTDFFLKTICRQARKRDPKEALFLLQAATFLIRRMHFYPISSSLLFDLYPKVKNFSSKDNPKIDQEKQTLLLAITEALKLTPSALPKSFGQMMENLAVTKTPHQFVEISAAISENKVTEKMIADFAWDLKKLEATFLTSIISLDLTDKGGVDTWKSIYIDWINRITHFAAAHILSYKDIQIRARCCKFYIQMINQCFKIGNLNTAQAFIVALRHTSIYRLKQTWTHIPEKTLMEFQQKEEIFSTNKSYKNYHTYVQQWKNRHQEVNAQNCLIPLLGCYLTYLNSIKEGNRMHLENGLLNPDMILLLAEQHHSFQNYQSQLLNFPELLSKEYTYDIPYQLKIKDHVIQKYSKKYEEALAELVKRSQLLEPPVKK